VATPGRPQQGAPTNIAALLAAILLATVASSTDVKYRRATAATAFPEAVVEALRGA
jgi:hypothetical protein